MITNLDLLHDYMKRNFIDGLFTAIPAKVVNVESFQSLQTVDVIPSIGKVWEDGLEEELPLINKVPIVMMGGGGALISVPIVVGDTVLLVFSCRDMDVWKVSDGSNVIAYTDRLHDINDAIAIPGLYTIRNNLSPNPTDVEIKYKGSSIKLKQNADITINTPANLTATVGGNVTINATGTVDVNVTGNATIDANQIIMQGGASGGVVCQAHVCSFTGTPHPQGSTTIKGGG